MCDVPISILGVTSCLSEICFDVFCWLIMSFLFLEGSMRLWRPNRDSLEGTKILACDVSCNQKNGTKMKICAAVSLG